MYWKMYIDRPLPKIITNIYRFYNQNSLRNKKQHLEKQALLVFTPRLKFTCKCGVPGRSSRPSPASLSSSSVSHYVFLSRWWGNTEGIGIRFACVAPITVKNGDLFKDLPRRVMLALHSCCAITASSSKPNESRRNALAKHAFAN